MLFCEHVKEGIQEHYLSMQRQDRMGEDEWPPVEPPIYTKQVGRPCKSRIKVPGEVVYSNGGKKISRHGVIMHCNYCGEPDHNIKGCKYLKAGLPPPNMQAPSPQGNAEAPSPPQGNDQATSPPEQHVQDEEPVIT